MEWIPSEYILTETANTPGHILLCDWYQAQDEIQLYLRSIYPVTLHSSTESSGFLLHFLIALKGFHSVFWWNVLRLHHQTNHTRSTTTKKTQLHYNGIYLSLHHLKIQRFSSSPHSTSKHFLVKVAEQLLQKSCPQLPMCLCMTFAAMTTGSPAQVALLWQSAQNAAAVITTPAKLFQPKWDWMHNSWNIVGPFPLTINPRLSSLKEQLIGILTDFTCLEATTDVHWLSQASMSEFDVDDSSNYVKTRRKIFINIIHKNYKQVKKKKNFFFKTPSSEKILSEFPHPPPPKVME